jgi:hypothetical protein
MNNTKIIEVIEIKQNIVFDHIFAINIFPIKKVVKPIIENIATITGTIE